MMTLRMKALWIRPFFLTFCFLALAACGFTPEYAARAQSGPAQEILRSVEIGSVPDSGGVMLKNKLMDRFYAGGRGPVRYRLGLDPLTESRQNLDITIDEEATRRQLRVGTNMVLTRVDTGAVLVRRPLYAIASYNVLQSQFTTRVTEQNARENAIADIARQVEQAVILALRAP